MIATSASSALCIAEVVEVVTAQVRERRAPAVDLETGGPQQQLVQTGGCLLARWPGSAQGGHPGVGVGVGEGRHGLAPERNSRTAHGQVCVGAASFLTSERREDPRRQVRRASAVDQLEQFVQVDLAPWWPGRAASGGVEPGKLEPAPAPLDEALGRLPGPLAHRRLYAVPSRDRVSAPSSRRSRRAATSL